MPRHHIIAKDHHHQHRGPSLQSSEVANAAPSAPDQASSQPGIVTEQEISRATVHPCNYRSFRAAPPDELR
ncbi:hypothetical protein J2T58_000917 [Methanocalculus alkaliphilus]|nr:hypothetical protein [Methanocalculus alkaliphilus]